jgi:hypothetical protein
MQEILAKKLHAYIIENNPELLLSLQQENRLTDYLKQNLASVDTLLNQLIRENKPLYLIEEMCLEEMTQALRPSKYQYIRQVIEEVCHETTVGEPGRKYRCFTQYKILNYEIINLIAVCQPLFDAFQFSTNNEDDPHLKYTIRKTVEEFVRPGFVARNLR